MIEGKKALCGRTARETLPFNLINMQILFRLHFFFVMLAFIVLHYPWWIFLRQIFYHSLPSALFGIATHFIQIFFWFIISISITDKVFHIMFFHFLPSFPFNIFMCFFQFFITDNFYVQQKPFFDSHQNSNITVLENESVVLKCVVKNKGNKTVSQNYF